MHYAPFNLKDGPWAAAKGRLLDATLRVLERHAPGVTASVVASQVITPDDLERSTQRMVQAGSVRNAL